jgi:hypothetical protein
LAPEPAEKRLRLGLVNLTRGKDAVARGAVGQDALGIKMPEPQEIGEGGVEPAFALRRAVFDNVQAAIRRGLMRPNKRCVATADL